MIVGRAVRGRSPALAVLAIAALFMSVSAALAQDDAFRRGLDAREKRQWQAVVSSMREAIKQRPRESTERVRSGIGAVFGAGGTEYLPYYFLGEAYYRYPTPDCTNAVNAWAESERQGALKSRPDFLKVVQDGYADCDKRGVLPPSKLDPALTRTLQQYNDVNGLARNISTLAEANLDIWRADNAMRQEYDRANAELKTANGRYQAAQASRTQADLQEASAAAERARTILVALEVSLKTAVDNRRTAQSLLREVSEAIAAADALSTAVSAKKVPFTPAMTATLQEGRSGIERAREREGEGRRTMNPPALLVARALATEASTRLRQLLDEIGRIEKTVQLREFNDALTRAIDAFSLLDSAVATLERFSAQRPGVLPEDKVAERDAAQQEVVRVRRRFDASRKAENTQGVADAARQATELRDRLSILIGAFGPLTLRDRGLNAVLEEGARLFFDGQYQQVVSTLEPGESFGDDVPLRLHVHLFRAAAMHQLFVRSGEKDEGLRAQALREVEHCKEIDSTFTPDVRAFSPRFIAFYRSVTPTAAPASASAAPAAAPPVPEQP
jgi:hypothetical protein